MLSIIGRSPGDPRISFYSSIVTVFPLSFQPAENDLEGSCPPRLCRVLVFYLNLFFTGGRHFAA